MIRILLSLFIIQLFVASMYSGYAHAITQSDLRAILSHHSYYDQTDTCETSSVTGELSVESTTVEENKKVIWQYFISKDLTPVQVAGIMGNFQAESGFEPRKVQYGFQNSRGETSVAGKPSSIDDNVPTAAGGYGLAQWTSSDTDLARKAGLIKLLEKRKEKDQSLTGGNLGLQLDHAWNEMSIAYKKDVLEALKKQTTIEGAVDIILNKYERPDNRDPAARNKFANQIFKQFTGNDPGSLSTETSSACGSTRSAESKNSNFIYYMQDEPKYAGINIPGSKTVESSGCGIVSFAMAIANLTDTTVTPATIVNKLSDYPDTQRGIWLVENYGADFGLKGKDLNNSIDAVINALQQGNYVISGGVAPNNPAENPYTEKGHVVLFTGLTTDGKIIVANPLKNWGENRAYTKSQIEFGMKYAMEITKI